MPSGKEHLVLPEKTLVTRGRSVSPPPPTERGESFVLLKDCVGPGNKNGLKRGIFCKGERGSPLDEVLGFLTLTLMGEGKACEE